MKPRVFFVEDDDVLRKVLGRELEQAGYEVRAFGTGVGLTEFVREGEPDVVLLDLRLPERSGLEVLQDLRAEDAELPVVMLTGHGAVPEAVEAMRLGAYDFLTKPVPLSVVEQILRRAIDSRHLVQENRRLRRAMAGTGAEEIIGDSAPVRELRALIHRVGPTPTSVLIQGENGTGKELVARSLHGLSPRSDQPFVVVNCAAIPENLVDSELFGHEKGAFTGADKPRLGLFEAAHLGTLFLDEVAELPLAVQPTLLRALQFGEVRSVGSERTRKVDVRVIAATNRDLLDAVAHERFREDLYYRIATVVIRVAPLRERRADIPQLVETFLRTACPKLGRRVRVEDAAMEELVKHAWPGNIRELQNVLTRLILLADDERVHVRDVHAVASLQRPPDGTLPTLRLEELERLAILAALDRHAGNKRVAAHELGVALKTLYNKLERFGLKEQFAQQRGE